jgi:hypothetical protein
MMAQILELGLVFALDCRHPKLLAPPVSFGLLPLRTGERSFPSARSEPVQSRGIAKPVSHRKEGRSLVGQKLVEEGRWWSRW